MSNGGMSALAQERSRRLIDLLREHGCDAIVVFGNAWQCDYLRFATDFGSLEGDAIAIVERDGTTRVFVELEGEAERAAAECRLSSVTFTPDLVATFAAQLPQLAARCRLAYAPAALAPMSLFAVLGRLAAMDATALFDQLLIVKSELEIAAVERASALADLGYKRFMEAARVGRPEYEVVGEVESFLRSRGCPENFMLLGSGGTEMRGMHPATQRRLAAGDLVTTELTPCVDGYYSQLCRTLVIGQPSEAQREAFGVFREAVIAGREAVRPGAVASAIARAQNDVFRARGLGEYTTSEYTRVRGHGLGLFPDSRPHILEDVDVALHEGSVLIVHPNTYHPQVGYIVLGDALAVTRDGYRNLAATPLELLSVPVSA